MRKLTIFLLITLLAASIVFVSLYFSGVINFKPEHNEVLTAADLNWHFGSFIRSAYNILSPTYDDVFSYDNNDTLIHVREILTYDCLVGAYASVPVTDQHLSISFQAKAAANDIDAKNLALRLVDPITKNAIKDVPVLGYLKDGSLETEFHQFGVKFTLPGYSEVIVMFYYYDAWESSLGQEFWIKDLKIITSGILPISTSLSPRDFTSFGWHIGAFYNDYFENPQVPLEEKPDQFFDYSLNSTELYLHEIGNGSYNAFVGAYAVVPVISGQLNFSFVSKITADPGKMPFLIYRFYDPETHERIAGLPDVASWTPASSKEIADTNTVQIELSVKIPNYYSSVILLIGFDDTYQGNNNYQCWISDFRI